MMVPSIDFDNFSKPLLCWWSPCSNLWQPQEGTVAIIEQQAIIDRSDLPPIALLLLVWSLYYSLFAPHICMVLFFTHIPFVVNHTINATPLERLQQYSCVTHVNICSCVIVCFVVESNVRWSQASCDLYFIRTVRWGSFLVRHKVCATATAKKESRDIAYIRTFREWTALYSPVPMESTSNEIISSSRKTKELASPQWLLRQRAHVLLAGDFET